MAANLDLLNPALKAKVITLLARCANRGFEMRPNRWPARPVRAGQALAAVEIDRGDHAEDQGDSMRWARISSQSVSARSGPQHGGHVTDAPPGFSWKAVDRDLRIIEAAD